MRKKQIEKVREEFERLDLSRWHILTYDELLKVNGGSGSDSGDDSESEESEELSSDEESSIGTETTVESSPSNGDLTPDTPGEESKGESGGGKSEPEAEDFHVTSHAEAAGMQAGDTITRSDGSSYTLNDGDIDYEQKYCDSHGIDWQTSGNGEKEDSPAKESDLPSAEDGENVDSVVTSSENEGNSTYTENNGNPASANSAANNTAEEKSEQGTANSSKESEHTAESGTVQSGNNKTSSNESSHTVSASHNEKSGHGFFGDLTGWLGEKINNAKNWACDFFGIGETSKVTENNIVEPVLTPTEKIEDAIEKVGSKDYIRGKYQCDEYVSDVIKKAGYDTKDYYVDDPSGKTVDEHISELKNSQKSYETDVSKLNLGTYVVFMQDKDGAKESHAALLVIESGSSAYIMDNSSHNNATEWDGNGKAVAWAGGTEKTTGGNASTICSWYTGYENFYFQELN
mgnify:CR=1 FL=1